MWCTISAGAAIAFLTAAACAAEPLRIGVDEGRVVVSCGNQDLLTYCYAGVPFKPYVQQFLSPGGVNVLRDNVADHLHHHGLMFALTVDGMDFWAETETCGRQEHRALSDVAVAQRGDVPFARFTERIDWINPATRDVVMQERRTIEVPALAKAGVSLMTWESVFGLPAGKTSVTFSGSHYVGLGMRFPQAMDAIGQFSNAENSPGEIVRGDERNTPAAWCAYTAAPDGKPVTVAMFSRPDNPRYPTTWFTMAKPFAYMSATLNVYKEPLTVTHEKPLVLRHGVAAWDGEVAAAEIRRVYERWTTLVGEGSKK
jgi:hypothetical protein